MSFLRVCVCGHIHTVPLAVPLSDDGPWPGKGPRQTIMIGKALASLGLGSDDIVLSAAL